MTTDIVHLGGESDVTGSCHLLRANGVNIMIDCGIAHEEERSIPIENWPIHPKEIDFLFLTHAHIDHIGQLPDLIHRGFKGEIICTHPTKQLLLPMINDVLNFSSYTSIEKINIKKSINEMSWGFEYREKFHLKKNIRFELRNSGHVLGSAFIYFDIDGYCVVFSGDIGTSDMPILPAVDELPPCDYLVMESTYGDRLHHNRENRIRQLGSVLSTALSDKGKVLIPSFSLGRTQELIYEMDRLFSDPEFQPDYPVLNASKKIPVFIDSPLGLSITKIYASLSQYWNQRTLEIYRSGNHPIDFTHLYAVNTHSDHRKLLDINGPCIIIAGGGMATGGRIIDHLKKGIEDSKNDIIFIGYQSEGTLGRRIASSSPSEILHIDGECLRVNAKIHTMSGYSAHADQKNLLLWVQSAQRKPKRIKLVHGEAIPKKVLSEKLSAEGYSIAD